MKKLGFKKVNRLQFRFEFAQILPLSIMLAAWLSSPSVGETTTSAVLRGLDTLPIQAPFHTIVGDRGRGDTPDSSDGVVAYWSSHLTGAKSELVVPGPHGSYALPQTVSELKRILHLNLVAVSAPQKSSRSADKKNNERPDRSPFPDQSLISAGLTAP
jgi:hypothetical protein